MYINGQRIQALISEGDTLFLAQIDSVQISSPRRFDNREDYLTYMRYKKYAAKVYPYAKKAVKIYREAEYVTRMMDKRSRKRHLKRLQKELEESFEKPLKKLTKTQGRILVEMIEKEIELPLYDIIKETRGTFLASYYTGMGTMFNYNLTEGYIEGQDELMDIVLRDFDVSHNVEKVIQKYHQERLPMIPNP
jgi:DNA-binding protein Fis